MKSLRPLLCRCLAALLPLAWTLHAGAASGSAAARPAASHKAGAQARATTADDAKPAPRARGAAHKAGVHKAGVKKASAHKAGVRQAGTPKAKATAVKASGKRPGTASAGARSPAKASAVRMPKQKRSGGPAVAAGTPQTRLDFSGRKRVGQASYYARRFAGRRMADGTRMRLNHHNAASKTLPLGTIAKVTNLKTGRSAVVKIQDRGPFVKGRIVDLSPATARAVGLSAREGVAPVEVAPIVVPMPDGSTRPGEGARDPMARTQVARARDTD